MKTIEMTDIDGDALTLIMRDGSSWITCTSGPDEVTVGPFPAHLLRRALLAHAQGDEQSTTTFLTAGTPQSDTREASHELRLLEPFTEEHDADDEDVMAPARRSR